jgi:hypothetical protein
VDCLSWHPVGPSVGNIRSSGADCIVEADPVSVEEKQRAKMASGMAVRKRDTLFFKRLHLIQSLGRV